MDYPVIELDTLFGKVHLTVLGVDSAHLETRNPDVLTINTVGYIISSRFKFGTPAYSPDNSPKIWYRDRQSGMNLRRKDWPHTDKGYTEKAFEAVEAKITPLVCSFLTQSPEIVKRAARVKVNNEISSALELISDKMKEIDQIKSEIATLELTEAGQ